VKSILGFMRSMPSGPHMNERPAPRNKRGSPRDGRHSRRYMGKSGASGARENDQTTLGKPQKIRSWGKWGLRARVYGGDSRIFLLYAQHSETGRIISCLGKRRFSTPPAPNPYFLRLSADNKPRSPSPIVPKIRAPTVQTPLAPPSPQLLRLLGRADDDRDMYARRHSEYLRKLMNHWLVGQIEAVA
jgi:hypothetical protein